MKSWPRPRIGGNLASRLNRRIRQSPESVSQRGDHPRLLPSWQTPGPRISPDKVKVAFPIWRIKPMLFLPLIYF
jgi:hypothetical protein